MGCPFAVPHFTGYPSCAFFFLRDPLCRSHAPFFTSRPFSRFPRSRFQFLAPFAKSCPHCSFPVDSIDRIIDYWGSEAFWKHGDEGYALLEGVWRGNAYWSGYGARVLPCSFCRAATYYLVSCCRRLWRRAPLNTTAAQAGIALLADATPEEALCRLTIIVTDAGSQLASLRAVFRDTSATAVFSCLKENACQGDTHFPILIHIIFVHMFCSSCWHHAKLVRGNWSQTKRHRHAKKGNPGEKNSSSKSKCGHTKLRRSGTRTEKGKPGKNPRQVENGIREQTTGSPHHHYEIVEKRYLERVFYHKKQIIPKGSGYDG